MIKRRTIQAVISFILMVVSIIATCVLHVKVDNQDIQYEAVKVTVISAESKKEHTAAGGYYTYHAIVEYEGVHYDLINIKSGEISKYEALANLKPETQNDNPYFDNTVYLSNGKMYSNIDGIKTDSKEFDWKLIAMGGIVVFFTLLLVCLEDIRNRKKYEESKKNPD